MTVKTFALGTLLATGMVVSSMQMQELKAYANNPISSAISTPISTAIQTIVTPPASQPQAQTQSQPRTTTSGTSSSSSSSSASKPSECTAQKPAGAPILFRIEAHKLTSVTLYWIKPAGPVNNYQVAFGRKPGVMEYGTGTIGDEHTTGYTINGLVKGQTYYFKVRGGNDCMPGAFSNEMGIKFNGKYTVTQLTNIVKSQPGKNAQVVTVTKPSVKKNTPVTQKPQASTGNIFSFITSLFTDR